jgi:carboxyl-terminal processing protease
MRLNLSSRWLLMLVGVVTTVSGAIAAPQLSLSVRKAAFIKVWTDVRDSYYDPKLNGVNWEAVRRRYAPRVVTVRSDEEFYALLNQMLGELKASHFAVIPPEAYVAETDAGGKAQGSTSGDGETGVTVQLVEGKPVITEVAVDSPAAQAGLKPGYLLTAIDGKPLDSLLKRVRARKLPVAKERLYVMFGVGAALSGPVGGEVKVSVLDAADHPVTVTLKRREPAGELVRFGELPPLYAHIETQRLPEGIGYIRFNIFLIPLLQPIKQAIHDMHDVRGIIVDLRGNLGGVGAMTSSIANELFDRQTTLGTMKMRQGEGRFAVFPVARPYLGPVVILTDEASVSSSEIMAGSLQESGRAHVVGRPTPGMVLPSGFERLPGGARLQLAFADFKTPKGILLEGRGVQPDVPVDLTRRALLAEGDPVLKAAVDMIARAANDKQTAAPAGVGGEANTKQN